MAWYAELKRRKWYCIRQTDMIYLYKKFLYDQWYNSLTDEQREIYHENLRRKKEKEEREAREAVHRLLAFSAAVSSMCGNNFYHQQFSKRIGKAGKELYDCLFD